MNKLQILKQIFKNQDFETKAFILWFGMFFVWPFVFYLCFGNFSISSFVGTLFNIFLGIGCVLLQGLREGPWPLLKESLLEEWRKAKKDLKK